jgi:6,7-dimethyl-8-ribityllumazine synthase
MAEPRERLEDAELAEEEEQEVEAEPDEAGPGRAAPAPSVQDDGWPGEHAPGGLSLPDEVAVLEGVPRGGRRTVGIVVSRYNGEITNRMLGRALEELEEAGVPPALVTVMPVPGAFELPLAAMALAKSRRFACVIALGCVIRGETRHFDYVAGEAASGLQLAALETGIPVSFGVLTVESHEQAEARIDRAADAVRSGLEMADAFAQLRATASNG